MLPKLLRFPREGRRNRRLGIVAILLLMVLALVNVIWKPFAPQIDPMVVAGPVVTASNTLPSNVAPEPSATQTATPSTSVHSSSASPTTSTSSASSCTSTSGEFVPTRLIYPRLGIDIPIMAQPLDGKDDLPDPPFGVKGIDAAHSGSWWNGGVKPGADKGSVYIGVHTYHAGGAVGNILGRGARAGDSFELRDAAGHRACFVVRGQMVPYPASKKAQPESYRLSGQPGAAFNFCWDEPANWGKWLQRGYVFADAV